jgi:lambda family phage portal protein
MNAAAKPRIRVAQGTTAFPHGLPSRPAPSSAFMRGDIPGGGGGVGSYGGGYGGSLFRWHPALREASDDVRQAWRLATARTVEQFQNSGWLSGAADASTAHVVGPEGLQLSLKPNAKALGWTQGKANEWARGVEARFSVYAENRRAADAGGRYWFGQLLAQAYRHWMATGEILATLPLVSRSGTQWRTKLRVLPAWRMSDRSEGCDLKQGVRIDPFSCPKSYILKVKTTYGGEVEQEFPATDGYGRPIVVHIFDGEPDQVRGITPFISVLKVARQFDQLADATLTAALIQTIFAAMFKSDAPGEDVLDALTSEAEQHSKFLNLQAEKSKWYQKTDINLGIHGKVLHGFPGDELQFYSSQHPNSTYEPFAKFLLRECSRAAAITYEEFTGDWAGATFSSSKMGVATNWPRIVYRRRNIVAPLAQSVLEAFIEEDIEIGGTEFPGGVDGFLANREAACQAFWRGPSMPQADELKTAMAAQVMLEIGLPKSIAYRPYSVDPDDAADERARERDYEDALDLEPGTTFGNPTDRNAALALTREPKQEQDGGEKSGEKADG